jgi:hypothetical protein
MGGPVISCCRSQNRKHVSCVSAPKEVNNPRRHWGLLEARRKNERGQLWGLLGGSRSRASSKRLGLGFGGFRMEVCWSFRATHQGPALSPSHQEEKTNKNDDSVKAPTEKKN